MITNPFEATRSLLSPIWIETLACLGEKINPNLSAKFDISDEGNHSVVITNQHPPLPSTITELEFAGLDELVLSRLKRVTIKKEGSSESWVLHGGTLKRVSHPDKTWKIECYWATRGNEKAPRGRIWVVQATSAQTHIELKAGYRTTIKGELVDLPTTRLSALRTLFGQRIEREIDIDTKIEKLFAQAGLQEWRQLMQARRLSQPIL